VHYHVDRRHHRLDCRRRHLSLSLLMSATLFVVVNHQDTKSDHQLTTPERLNVDCDHRAANVPLPCTAPNIQKNPPITASYPHVRINGQIIHRQIQYQLRDAATSREYQEYLQNKFQWTDATTAQVHWKMHQLANQRLSPSERRIISKFIHEWLPLLDRYHVQSSSISNICPSCRGATEDVSHFLNCPHPDRQQIWTKLHDGVFKLHIKQNAPPSYYNVITHGLYTGRGANSKCPIDHDDTQTRNIIQQQEQLGWKQLYYGRFTRAWAHGITASQQTIKGVVFYSQVITLIWQAVAAQWTVRNTHLHPPNSTQDDRTQLAQIVYQIVHEAQADPNLQDMIMAFDPEVLLRRPIKHIRHWITNSKNHMAAQQKAAQAQAQLQTNDIRTYFPRRTNPTEPSTNEKNLLRPP